MKANSCVLELRALNERPNRVVSDKEMATKLCKNMQCKTHSLKEAGWCGRNLRFEPKHWTLTKLDKQTSQHKLHKCYNGPRKNTTAW